MLRETASGLEKIVEAPIKVSEVAIKAVLAALGGK